MIAVRLAAFSLAAILAGGASVASAAQVDLGGTLYDVDFIAGTGSNASLVSIDFGPKSYNFGVQWNGTAPTGFEAVNALSAASAGTLTVYAKNFGPGFDFVTGFKYKEFDLQSDTDGLATPETTDDDYPNLWWAYYTSTTGADWIFPGDGDLGPSDVFLVNGEFQGWMRESTDWPGVAPDVVAVPEPASLALLAVAGSALMLRRKSRAR